MNLLPRKPSAFTLLETAVALALLVIVFAITAPSISKAYKERYFAQEFRSLQKAHLAILSYVEDRRNDGGETAMFPSKLTDLLTDNYLEERDLDPAIVYIQRANNAPTDFVMLRRSTASGLLVCTIQGPPQRAEQNPESR